MGKSHFVAMETLCSLKAGDAAPVFEWRAQAEGRIRLSDLRGQTVLLAFFPTDWDPARETTLELYARLVDELPGDVQLVGVTCESHWCEIDLEARGRHRFQLMTHMSEEVAELYGVPR